MNVILNPGAADAYISLFVLARHKISLQQFSIVSYFINEYLMETFCTPICNKVKKKRNPGIRLDVAHTDHSHTCHSDYKDENLLKYFPLYLSGIIYRHRFFLSSYLLLEKYILLPMPVLLWQFSAQTSPSSGPPSLICNEWPVTSMHRGFGSLAHAPVTVYCTCKTRLNSKSMGRPGRNCLNLFLSCV